ncbi:hypothetical protein MKX01_029698 [Papaver californicum]|nr:hypothetical protein MKX01_029698 [Papaver californicum]
MRLFPYALTLFFIAGLRLGSAVVGTTITPTKFLTDPETIVSSKRWNFQIRIWYNNIPGPTIVWVANRDHPLNDSSGVLRIASDGNLVVVDGQGRLCWTTNVTATGYWDLVLRESSTNYNHNEGRYFWQSFDHPTNALLPKMQFGMNLRTGKKQTVTSWRNDSDPSTGDFTLELDPYVIPQLIIKNGAKKKWRSGPWVEEFLGMDHPSSDFKLEKDYSRGTVFLSILYEDKSTLSRIVLEYDGKLVGKQWHEEKKQWLISWSSNIYNKCGPFGIYKQYSQTCSCMRGFEPKFMNEWKYGSWSGGCARRKDLQCAQSSERTKVKEVDGFLEVDMWNVPDYYHLMQGISYVQCHDKCLRNCSCIAYSYSNYDPSFGCMWWTGDLIDARETSEKLSFNLHIRVARKMKRGMRKSVEWERKRRYRKRKKKNIRRSFVYSDDDYGYGREPSDSVMLIQENTELREIDFKTLVIATDNFSEANKLGQGGFGSVYKSDPKVRGLFDWKRRFEIVLGISRWILYLHRDSRLRVIHRDLKASNILLDEELNPKISDFGMARIFGSNERLQANTRKVAGTFGYMSPEYVMEGKLSEKSDVFSFGVLLLEIVSGKRNSSLCNQELSLRLLGHAWQLWNENNAQSLFDPTLVLSEPSFEEFAVDRPTMATSLSMLTSEIATLPTPKNPAFSGRHVLSDSSSSQKIQRSHSNNNVHSSNDVSITILGGR